MDVAGLACGLRLIFPVAVPEAIPEAIPEAVLEAVPDSVGPVDQFPFATPDFFVLLLPTRNASLGKRSVDLEDRFTAST